MVKTEDFPCFYVNQSETRTGTDVMLLSNTCDRQTRGLSHSLKFKKGFLFPLVTCLQKIMVDARDVKRTNFQPRSQGEGRPWKRG